MNGKQNNKNELIRVIVAVLVAFAVYKCLSSLVIRRITDGSYNRFAGEFAMLMCALGAAAATKKLNLLKWSGKGFGAGLLVGIIIIVQATFVLASWIAQIASGAQSITVSGGKIILLFIASIMIGIGEELLFRGVLLDGLLDYFGNGSVAALRKAILFSGLLFGFLHLFNILSGAAVVGSVVQAIDAAVNGMLFGAVYVRSGKNLWPGIAIHAYLDLCGFLSCGALMNVSTADVVSGYTPSMLILTGVRLIVVLFVCRSKKLLPLTNKAEAKQA